MRDEPGHSPWGCSYSVGHENLRNDRHVIELAHGEPRQSHADPLIRSRARCHGIDRTKGTIGTRGVRGAVVDAIRRQVRQRTPIGIHRRSRPRCIENAVHRRPAHPEESAENCDAGQKDEANRNPREALSCRDPHAAAFSRFSTLAVFPAAEPSRSPGHYAPSCGLRAVVRSGAQAVEGAIIRWHRAPAEPECRYEERAHWSVMDLWGGRRPQAREAVPPCGQPRRGIARPLGPPDRTGT